IYVHLRPWGERSGTAMEFIRWAGRILPGEIHDAKLAVFNLPTVRGLGYFGGFDLYLEDRAGLGRTALAAAQDTLLEAAAHEPALSGVRANLLPPAPQVKLTVDRVQAQSIDRKSTRLNSSHLGISYAVFCLKRKKSIPT